LEVSVTENGKFAFFPWVTLPKPCLVGGFRFVPIDVDKPETVIDAEILDTVKLLFKRYIDLTGKPIQKCTVALRPRHQRSWDIPENLWSKFFQASEFLALVAMAEQRFFEGHFSSHINATVFRPVIHGINPGKDRLSISVRWRDGGLLAGGYRFEDVIFQMPREAYSTECPSFSLKFAKALDRARTSNSTVAMAIKEALPFFLLGHSEATEMPSETCVLLSALSFERLLQQSGRELKNANCIAKAFSGIWTQFSNINISDAKRIKQDPHDKHGTEQLSWPVHRKWIKELYEARSEHAHGGKNSGRSSNWLPWQHVVCAAFAFPLTVKILLERENLYQLEPKEKAACDAFDKLLASDFGNGWRRPPEWPKILSEEENRCDWDRIYEDVLPRIGQSSDQ